ncbi:MAG: HNH endonuclease [bacterium]
MAQNWRWDQGRLDYFQFDNMRAIARCLVKLDGLQLNVRHIDPLRNFLEAETGLPFLPRDKKYRVWRNYGRVFKCALLATDLDNHLVVTDLCRNIARMDSAAFSADEYFALFIPRFYFPFPGFQGYDRVSPAVFPFCAVLKYLIARFPNTGDARITLEDVFRIIIGNNCTGKESIEFYGNLQKTNYLPKGDQKRQVREMLIFASQISFLKWYANTLYLDIQGEDQKNFEILRQITHPKANRRNAEPASEILALGTVTEKIVTPALIVTRELPADIIFTEGKRMRIAHLRIERSPRLRRLLFAGLREPFLCDMCSINPKHRYPWTENILELHHLLPLSAPLAITAKGTSFDDVVPLCPNCHKSVHSFYRYWLDNNSQDDFLSRVQAKNVYSEAKERVQI